MKLLHWILVSAFLLRRFAASGALSVVYKKIGDEVVLKPEEAPVIDAMRSILWLHGSAIAVDFDSKGTEYFRQFKDRGKLNILNGELTITGLTLNDSGVYTAEIDNLPAKTATRLQVISPVPVPSVHVSCNDKKTICTLECVGNIQADAEPVYYNWKFGDVVKLNSSKQHTCMKEDSAAFREISCEVVNAVTQEHSLSIANPFTSSNGGTGIIVFFSLLGAMLLLVLSHKCLTGKWFFQKGSMPWKADFWRKEGISVTEVI